MQASDMDIDESSADEMDISESWPTEPSGEQLLDENNCSDLESDVATHDMDVSPDRQPRSSGSTSKGAPTRAKSGSFDGNEEDESDDDTKETTMETGTHFSCICIWHSPCVEELLLPVKNFFHERLKVFLAELGGAENLIDEWTTQVSDY